MNREKAVNREKANVMAAASGRRRLRALEGLILIVSLTEYAPLTFAEIEAIAHRVRRSGRLTAWDVTRGPAASRDAVFEQRYIGVFRQRSEEL
jgi:hypothetical protein